MDIEATSCNIFLRFMTAHLIGCGALAGFFKNRVQAEVTLFLSTSLGPVSPSLSLPPSFFPFSHWCSDSLFLCPDPTAGMFLSRCSFAARTLAAASCHRRPLPAHELDVTIATAQLCPLRLPQPRFCCCLLTPTTRLGSCLRVDSLLSSAPRPASHRLAATFELLGTFFPHFCFCFLKCNCF